MKHLRHTIVRQLKTGSLVAAVCAGGWSTAQAGDISINYDRFSFLEEPLAKDVLGFTVSAKQLSDAAIVIDKARKGGRDGVLTSVFEINAERQLPNALTIGGSYLGTYERDGEDSYGSQWAAYVSGVWGAMLVGDVVGVVREETRRHRGFGNAELAFDDFWGTADRTGVAYRGRYSAYVVTSAFDNDGEFDLGVSYRRPNQWVDTRYTVRATNGEFHAADGSGRVNTRGASLVGEITYGSLVVDAGIGFEKLDGTHVTQDRWFFASGANYKYNAYSISVAGLIGDVDGAEEKSFSVGGAVDVARGASVNIGYNYERAQATLASDDGKKSEWRVSLRYEY